MYWDTISGLKINGITNATNPNTLNAQNTLHFFDLIIQSNKTIQNKTPKFNV